MVAFPPPSLRVSLICLCTGIILLLSSNFSAVHYHPALVHPKTSSSRTLSRSGSRVSNLEAWLTELREDFTGGVIHTTREACREFFSGGQSCIFNGLTCVDLRQREPRNSETSYSRVPVIFVDDVEVDGEKVLHDNWCGLKHLTADPRNGGPRVWNPEEWTIAPRWSCLDAVWRRWDKLRKEVREIKLLDDLWLVDLDYIGGDHNNHMLKDTVWILDLVLWQRSLSLRRPEGGYFPWMAGHIMYPGRKADFDKSMKKDINRLIWALILELDLDRLYANIGSSTIKAPQSISFPWRSRRNALMPHIAYPEVFREERMLFHRDLVDAGNGSQARGRMTLKENGTAGPDQPPASVKTKKYDLLCTRKFVAGAKLPNYGDERVCHRMRTKSWALFGIQEPRPVRRGILVHAPPPKRIVIINRSRTRKLQNDSVLLKEMAEAFKPYGVEVELISTASLRTAESNVRAYSRAGVLISPHGSQSMSLIFMPRFSAIIEVFPFAYRHYAFKFAADSCQVFHFEVYGKPSPKLTQQEYDYCLTRAGPLEMSACAVGHVKHADIPIDSKTLIEKSFLAFAKMGYDLLGVKLH